MFGGGWPPAPPKAEGWFPYCGRGSSLARRGRSLRRRRHASRRIWNSPTRRLNGAPGVNRTPGPGFRKPAKPREARCSRLAASHTNTGRVVAPAPSRSYPPTSILRPLWPTEARCPAPPGPTPKGGRVAKLGCRWEILISQKGHETCCPCPISRYSVAAFRGVSKKRRDRLFRHLAPLR